MSSLWSFTSFPKRRIPKAAKPGHILKGTVSYVKSDTGKKAVRIGILFLLRFAFNRKRQTGDWLGRRTRNPEIAGLSPAS